MMDLKKRGQLRLVLTLLRIKIDVRADSTQFNLAGVFAAQSSLWRGRNNLLALVLKIASFCASVVLT